MKLVNLFGAGALIAGTLVAAAPAEAQSRGYYGGGYGFHHRGPAYRPYYGGGYRPHYRGGYRSHYRGGYRPYYGGGYRGRPYGYGYRNHGYGRPYGGGGYVVRNQYRYR